MIVLNKKEEKIKETLNSFFSQFESDIYTEVVLEEIFKLIMKGEGEIEE